MERLQFDMYICHMSQSDTNVIKRPQLSALMLSVMKLTIQLEVTCAGKGNEERIKALGLGKPILYSGPQTCGLHTIT